MTNGKRLLVLAVIIALAIGIAGAAQAAADEAAVPAKARPARAAIARKFAMAKAWAARKAENNPDAIAQRIADMADLPEETILSYKESGLTWPQVMDKAGLTFSKVAEYRKERGDEAMAKRLAAKTGKSEAEILSMKTDENTWKDVIKTLGITPEKIKERAKGK